MNKEKVLIIIGVMIMAITIGSAMIYNSISTNLINGNLIASTTTTENVNKIVDKEDTYSLQLYDDKLNPLTYPNVVFHREESGEYVETTVFEVKQIIAPDIMLENQDITKYYGELIANESKVVEPESQPKQWKYPSNFVPIDEIKYFDFSTLFDYALQGVVGYKFNGLNSLELTYFVVGYRKDYDLNESTINKSFTYTLKYKQLETESVKKNKGDSKQRFSVNSNELMNVKNKTNDIPIFEAISNSLITNYVDGKKTAFLTCKYGEYRDTSNNIVYNGSDGKCISIGDYVIPYKRKNGVDVPLAKYINGNPMVFIVTSSEIVYNGYININIELLERTDN